MLQELKKNIISSINTILPIFLLVLFLSLFLPISKDIIISFFLSSILLIGGLSLFTFGSDLSMVVIGKKIGKDLVKSKKIWFILIISFIIGIVITIAEPDLFVLTEQFTSIPNYLLIFLMHSFNSGLQQKTQRDLEKSNFHCDSIRLLLLLLLSCFSHVRLCATP